MDSTPTLTRTRCSNPGGEPADSLRYSAVVSGAGEIQPIQEFIGRRLLRQIDPCSRLGRRLLTGGRVCLWCESVARGERLAVADLLGRLRERALREVEEGGGGTQGWSRCCRHRLEAIERWQAYFGARPTADS
jgi:hypothetical protein